MGNVQLPLDIISNGEGSSGQTRYEEFKGSLLHLCNVGDGIPSENAICSCD